MAVILKNGNFVLTEFIDTSYYDNLIMDKRAEENKILLEDLNQIINKMSADPLGEHRIAYPDKIMKILNKMLKKFGFKACYTYKTDILGRDFGYIKLKKRWLR